MPRKLSKAAQTKTQQARLALIEKSKQAKQWKETAAEAAEENGDFEKAAAIEEMSVNDVLRLMIAKEAGRDDFNTAAEWKKQGFRIAKGETAYRVWGSPVKAISKEEPTEAPQGETESEALERKYKLWPMCCLFHGGQVVPLDEEPKPETADREEEPQSDSTKQEEPAQRSPQSAESATTKPVDVTGSPFVREDYADAVEAKRERFASLAQKNLEVSTNETERAIGMVHGLPAGQPILVGHHSEKRHRALLERSDNAMKRGIDADKKADYYQERAASVGSGGIQSDDPDALEKLMAERDKRVTRQNHMKAVNKALRKGGDEALKALDLTDEQIKAIRTPNCFGDIGYASFELTNNNAQIRRLNKRIEDLQRLYTTELPELESEAVAVEFEQGRAMINFKDGKPNVEARDIVKKAGFRWSRYNERWTRKLNQRAIFEAKRVFQQINELDAVY